MQEHKFDGYTLKMQATNKTDKTGHVLVAYEFTAPDGEVLFEGGSFGASPLHSPEGKESAKALLSFLTLKPGDTDSEYFDNYTPHQLEFCNSFECEELQLYTMDED